MIELPEAWNLVRQINATLRGRRIVSSVRDHSPHKFAFYTRPRQAYEAILQDRTIGQATDQGSSLLVAVEPDYALLLGGGGQRILYHPNETRLPAKHQLLLRFEAGDCLTVTVQGWGCLQLLDAGAELPGLPVSARRVSPLTEAFTYDYFQSLFAELDAGDARTVKYFLISRPCVWGMGNGYLQDILFRAGLHPRRRAVSLTEAERHALYAAVRETLRQGADRGGRDTERDLFNRPGDYRPLLDRRSAGQPCPQCGRLVERIQHHGGACYFCPCCQREQG